MKNKYIIILLTFVLSLVSFTLTKGEEFNFNTTELQITENGNIIKGINGGEVTTRNNEIIITANNFKYNKLTTLLEAEGNVKVIDKIKDIIIEANEIFYIKNEEKIFSIGKTNIKVDNKYDIDGKDLTLLRNENKLSSNEKAIITNNNSDFYELEKFEYSINEEILKGEQIKVTEYQTNNETNQYFFQKGFFNLKTNKFLGKDVNIIFQKLLFDDIENDPRGSGVAGYGDKLNTYIDNAVFTSCKKTDKCPPWKMRAKNIQHDRVKKQIIYKNAWLDIYDFPVVYFPKFFHPDPSVKRQSGLIRPEIGDHTTLGDSIYLPYFIVISDDKDMTIKPRLFNNDITVLQSEYRQKTKNSTNVIDASITNGHNSSENDAGGNRSHFFANSKIDLDLKTFLQSDLEINFEKVSNDTYLKLFDFMRSPLLTGKDNKTLESSIKLDLQHESYDLTTSFEMYETLGAGSNSDRYYYILPSFGFTKIFDLENFDGTFDFYSFGNNSLSQTNVTSTAVNNNLMYTAYDSFFNNGIKKNFEFLLKNINALGKNSTDYKSSPQSELISTYNYNISLPLKKDNENYINRLTPKLSFKVTPHDMKNNSTTNRKINVDNIFSLDRLALGNTLETGESFTLGIDFTKDKINNLILDEDKLTEIERYFDFKLATVLKFSEEKNIPTISTLNKKNSNIFGQTNFYPNKNTSINYNFSLTDSLDRFESNSFGLAFEFDNFSTTFNYLEESGIMGNSNIVSNSTTYNFNEYNSLSFDTRRNREINLTEYYDLVYEYKNDCLVAEVKYRKDYYNSADIKPKEELFFSITIVPFYTYSPDKMILNKDRID